MRKLCNSIYLFQFIGGLTDFTAYTFPNWIVPCASLWSLFNFFSLATDSNIASKLQKDFGVTANQRVNSNFREKIKHAHIISGMSYTITGPLPSWINQHFRHVVQTPRRDEWFYSATEDRIKGNLDYDFNMHFPYDGKVFEFVTFERQSIQVPMVCTFDDIKIWKWETFAHVVDIKVNATTRLMMIRPNDPREPLDSVMNALKVWPLNKLRKLSTASMGYLGVCFPRFKVLIEADYSPILFKMGYDYLFTPERLDLTQLGVSNVRVNTNVRAFVQIWDAENDYDDPTIPYDYDTTSHFIVDKPFVFILYDSKTNLPWLVGKLNNPREYRHFANSASRYKMFP